MNYEYNDKPITYNDSYLGTITITPLSNDILNYIGSLGCTITYDHMYPEDPTDSGRFHYIIEIPGRDYGASILKGAGSIGREKDQFEIHILYKGMPSHGNDISDQPIGYLIEEDVCCIIRLVCRLDEYGRLSRGPLYKYLENVRKTSSCPNGELETGSGSDLKEE